MKTAYGAEILPVWAYHALNQNHVTIRTPLHGLHDGEACTRLSIKTESLKGLEEDRCVAATVPCKRILGICNDLMAELRHGDAHLRRHVLRRGLDKEVKGQH
eukprot:CAMPEP_0119419048 /NCGR_PEP_ID=MMETSP1335-20130426/19815_1 /TAXON_ID=259385 /ORGANISM="Chrysoculter rhomboideus, Strain RCC1486" /LENGTH=101 /DNA_ID=CAMNT_0007444325 /DNA_START=36 /DNA_END=342 /DNA_ORIENTATION=-